MPSYNRKNLDYRLKGRPAAEGGKVPYQLYHDLHPTTGTFWVRAFIVLTLSNGLKKLCLGRSPAPYWSLNDVPHTV